MTEADRLSQRLLDMKSELERRLRSIDRDIRHEGMSADWSEQASERENDEVLESLGSNSEKELRMPAAYIRDHAITCWFSVPSLAYQVRQQEKTA